MSLLNTIFQAIIQGLTEFLPVSSSGHLSLYQHFTGNSGEGALMFSAVLHLGTLVAVFVAFRKTICALIKEFFSLVKDIFTGKFKWKEMNPERRMIFMIIISTACLIPFMFFKGWFEGISEDNSIFAEGLCFLYTAGILFMSDKCVKGKKTAKDIKTADAVSVGFFRVSPFCRGYRVRAPQYLRDCFADFHAKLPFNIRSFWVSLQYSAAACLR